MTLKNKRIVIIGGSSGIGFATAAAAYQEGAIVIIASRDNNKLSVAKTKIGQGIIIKQVDILDELNLKNFFQETGTIDHLQLPGSDLKTGPFLTFAVDQAKQSFASKFWGPYLAAKYAQPYLHPQGSITFYSGAYSAKPAPTGSAIAAAINSAVEGLARALALELAPIRVNVIAPGLTLTERFTTNYTSEQIEQMMDKFATNLIIKRPAHPGEIAQSAIYLMQNTYTTGSTLFVDGGYSLR